MTAQELLYLQEEDYLEEFLTLLKNDEQQIRFAKKWMSEIYIRNRNAAFDMWIQLAEQFCPYFSVDFDEMKWAKDFAFLQRDLWPKYLQAGLNEMGIQLK